MSIIVLMRYISAMSTTLLILERIGALIHQSVRDDAARHGLQPIHVQVLGYLTRANHYSDLPIAVSEFFGITRGTVSQTLTLLEGKGLLTKEKDGKDARLVHLRLTAAGRKILQDSWAQKMEIALRSMPTDAARMDQSLRALLTGLQRLNGQRPFGVCRQCAHFLTEEKGARCGLTGEALRQEQTVRICREWQTPAG